MTLMDELLILRKAKAEEAFKNKKQQKADFINKMKPIILKNYDQPYIHIMFTLDKDRPSVEVMKEAFTEEGFFNVEYRLDGVVINIANNRPHITPRNPIDELEKATERIIGIFNYTS